MEELYALPGCVKELYAIDTLCPNVSAELVKFDLFDGQVIQIMPQIDGGVLRLVAGSPTR